MNLLAKTVVMFLLHKETMLLSKNMTVRNVAGSYIHLGLDFGNNPDRNIRAMDSGRVREVVDYVNGIGHGSLDGSYGLYVWLEHNHNHVNRYRSLYAHLDSVSVVKDNTPNKNAIMGQMGGSGLNQHGNPSMSAYSVHLHTEFHYVVSDRLNRRLYPFSYLVDDMGHYDAGRAFDYIQRPMGDNSKIRVNAYHIGGSNQTKVYIVYQVGSHGDFVAAQMISVGNNHWDWYPPPSLQNTTINYYIVATREHLERYRVTRPARYRITADSPSTDIRYGNPQIYYRATFTQIINP